MAPKTNSIMNKEDYYRSHASKQKCTNKIQNHRSVPEEQIPAVDSGCSRRGLFRCLERNGRITRGVSVRTVQADIQVMRSDKLGYEAPIEVYEGKFYRYADEDYSISNSPLDSNMCDLISDAIDKLRQFEKVEPAHELGVVLSKVKHKLELLLDDA